MVITKTQEMKGKFFRLQVNLLIRLFCPSAGLHRVKEVNFNIFYLFSDYVSSVTFKCSHCMVMGRMTKMTMKQIMIKPKEPSKKVDKDSPSKYLKTKQKQKESRRWQRWALCFHVVLFIVSSIAIGVPIGMGVTSKQEPVWIVLWVFVIPSYLVAFLRYFWYILSKEEELFGKQAVGTNIKNIKKDKIPKSVLTALPKKSFALSNKYGTADRLDLV